MDEVDFEEFKEDGRLERWINLAVSEWIFESSQWPWTHDRTELPAELDIVGDLETDALTRIGPREKRVRLGAR